MQILLNVLIYSGSALMVYNIIRYFLFLKASVDLEHKSRSNVLLTTPLLLLVFFLIGYLVIGITGVANFMVAAILLGGSIFVFLLMTVMFSIISHVRETDQILSQRFDEMKAQLNAMTKHSMSAFLVNLSKDIIEDRRGEYLYVTDYQCDTYSELLKARCANVLDPSFNAESSVFRREELLRLYHEGQTNVSRVMLVRRRDGETGFVRYEATMTLMPVSGDVIAVITENSYDEQVVRTVLLEKIMMGDFDHIAYMIDGKYHVLMSNSGKKSGLVLPADPGDTYESVYYNYFLPAMERKEDRSDPNPLRLSVIEKALSAQDLYDVNVTFETDRGPRYKRILFYCVERGSKFYLMLISDSTRLQEEQAQQNKLLSDALAQKERSDRARRRFIEHISHDLQIPFKAMMNAVDKAGKETAMSSVREDVKIADRAAAQFKSLMDDLFDMSLIVSGAFKLEPERADLRDVVSSIVSSVSDQFAQKGCIVTADVSKLDRPGVICDPRRLSAVIKRLLENSCAFMQPGENASLTVTHENGGDTEHGTYLFTVSNRGVPIPAEVLPHIFEESSWEGNEKSDELPGVGIGMIIAKAIIDRMSGSIKAESDEKGNTAFTVRLSVPYAESGPEEKENEISRPLHVLLVDDNEINREIGELMLTNEGWTVDQASDGEEAVKKVSSSAAGTYDLVLMDVQMPVMDGYAATAAIRALPDPALASVPVIAVTANAFAEDVEKAKNAGMNSYVTKPISAEAIRRAASEVLGE